MCESTSGVAKQIQDEEPRALFTHCYGHSLPLRATDECAGPRGHGAVGLVPFRLQAIRLRAITPTGTVSPTVSLNWIMHACVL